MSIAGTVVSILHGKSAEPRHEQRRIIRRELAEKQLRTEQRVAGQAEVQSLEAQLDVATAEHGKITGPIQDALAKLDAERLDAMADRKTLSTTWQTRRDAEQKRLDAANLDLEKIATEFRQRLKVANDTLREASQREMEYIGTLPPGALRQAHLVNPDLQIQATITGHAVEFATKREAAARHWLERVQEAVAIAKRDRPKIGLGEAVGTLGFQLVEAQAVLTAATKAKAESQRVHNLAIQAIEDE